MKLHLKKRQLKRLYNAILAVKPQYFLLAAGVCSLLCVAGLRHNNQHMASLRAAVYTADKNGGDVQLSLNRLQAYVTSHMNTGLSSGATSVYPPIQLQYTYQRLVDQRSQQTQNSDLYTQAQAYCQGLNSKDFSGRNRVPCIEQYVQQHGAQTLPTISPSLYQFDFVAPKWSPDLAGWGLLATILFLLLTTATFVVDRRIKRRLA